MTGGKIPRLGTRLALLGSAAALLASAPVRAQAWTVRDAALSAGRDSVAAVAGATPAEAAARAVAAFAARGWGLALADTSADLTAARTVRVVRGPRLVVADVTVVGAHTMAPTDVRHGWRTRPGAAFVPALLEADLAVASARYTALGYPDARIVARPHFAPADTTVRVEVHVDVVEGAEARIAGVELVGVRGARRAFATRVTGLAPETPLSRYDASAVQAALAATGLYAAVGTPTLAREADGRVTVRVPVEPGPPGAFDLVLGLLPAADGAPARVVGSGRVELVDPFGGGETVRVGLVRTPGLASSLDVALRDPFVLGRPVSLDAAFAGESRDSTFSRQSLRADAGLRIAPGLQLTGGISREGLLPGRAASAGGAPRVQRSTAVFFGAGVRFTSVDHPLRPRRGVVLEAVVESGVRRRTAADTAAAAPSPRQQRLTAMLRAYLPAARRLTLVSGVDARVLVTLRGRDGLTAPADEGELFRTGGAASLRGYDEDQFLGSAVGRALAEARWALDAASYAALFTDVGYVVRPDLPDRPGSRRTRPGYGVGVVLATGLGPVAVSYALHPGLPFGRGKVHVGVRVGL